MKKLLFFCTFMAMTINVNAQVNLVPNGNSSYCKTPSKSSNLIELENIRGLDHTNDLFQVKLYVHLLRKQQTPKYGQSIENVNRLMKVLYDDFDSLGIYFVWDGEIDYIDNTDFFNHPYYYTDPVSGAPIFTTNNHTDGIDIYLFDELLSQDQPNGFGLANGIGESTELIVGGYWFGDKVIPLSRLKVISHEMGHVLFLWHTHHGTDPGDNGTDPNACAELVNPVTSSDDPENDPVYLEQHANRQQCGDYISDTPADPNLIGNIDGGNCNYTGSSTDANGDTYQPDTGNLMSYTYPTCLDRFTLGQKGRMKNALWYLPALNQTILTDYTYIRAGSNNNCFVCDENYFSIYTSYDVSQLSISSSANIVVTANNQGNNSLFLTVTSLLDPEEEGEQGFINVSVNNNLVLSQPIWVGKPQTLPDDVLSGTGTVYANQEFSYGIGLDNRLKGIDTYEWVFPDPNAEVDNYNNPNPSTWQYLSWSKYYTFTQGLAGNQTGTVKVHGLNPCGEGKEGIENEICVLNTNDPEGDTECVDGNPPPPPIIYYPNPADSLLEIDLSLQDYKVYTVVIYDQYQTVKYSDQSTNVIKTINVFNLTNGTYYLHIYDDNGDNILSRILIINH